MRQNGIHIFIELLIAYQFVVIGIYLLYDCCPKFVVIFKSYLNELVYSMKYLFQLVARNKTVSIYIN